MKKCLICDAYLEEFLDLGKMPIANGFLSPDQFDNEYFFELKVGFCTACKMVQLTEHVAKEKMFHENYAFYSSTSKYMSEHFKRFAKTVQKEYLNSSDTPAVIEMGSNDGIMLKNFAAQGIQHLGIEPSANVAQVAIDNGVNTIVEFFDADLAKQIIDEFGQTDAFLSANVMCHIPYIHKIIEGIELLLKPKGVFIFEDPYLGDIVQKTSYDQIYDEHAFYFSVTSVSYLMEMHGLELIDVIPQKVHGGSMRYTIARKGAYEVSNNVSTQKEMEITMGLEELKTYNLLTQEIEKSNTDLVALLNELKSQGKSVVGYGATSKSTTITNFCGLSTDLLEYISDTTPIKQGKFSPGVHIPVRPYEEFKTNYPDYALLFAWNHSKEIMDKEEAFKNSGGKWIVYVPNVKILE